MAYAYYAFVPAPPVPTGIVIVAVFPVLAKVDAVVEMA